MNKTYYNGLIFLCAVAAIYASYAWPVSGYYALKPLTSILIIGLMLFFREGNHSQTSTHQKAIIVALLFCLLGDVFLLDYAYFAYGLGSFLIAHLIFASVFFRLSGEKQYWGVLVAITLISATYFYVIYPGLEDLKFPVLIYFSCIGVMCWQGFRVALLRRDKWGYLLALATISFVISDATIAANEFIAPFAASNAIILSLYWLSITLIANLFSGKSAE